MSRGVLYFNHGTRCLLRLAVSLFSLRKHYSGDVAIACEGDLPELYRSIFQKLNARIIAAPVSNEFGLIKKSRLWRIMPFDVTLFLDADTLIRAPVDYLIEKTAEHGLVVTRFHDWQTRGRRMRGRLEQWRAIDSKAVDAALDYPWATNTGIQGWRRGHPALPQYEAMTARGIGVRGVHKKTLDEIAMQLLLPSVPHFMATSEWNVGPIHGSIEGAKILHYHGHKHTRAGVPACDLWKGEFFELLARFPEHAEALLSQSDDDSAEKWIRSDFGRRNDLTVVTAVNPAYADCARANIAKWMALPGLREQRFIVFVNGFRNSTERKFLDLPNVKVVRWSYPFDATDRETMLAAFILGVAQYVKTDYWLKLDCDAVPKKPYFALPEYRRHTITSHKWGYTKMKGDPDATEHWFNRLDKVFGGSIFPLLSVKDDYQVSHRPGNKLNIPMRFGSFCHFEKTAFTRRMAEIVLNRCNGRLPVPSQDTLSWYCATLWKEPIKLMNMKEWFQP